MFHVVQPTLTGVKITQADKFMTFRTLILSLDETETNWI